MVEIKYVDGSIIRAANDSWSELRGDGIDYADLNISHTGYRMQGKSVYWLRKQNGMWVIGGGTVTDVEEATLDNDEFVFQRIDYMPDLPHASVKLGWWE